MRGIRPTGRYTGKDEPVSEWGFPIKNCPDRLLLPGELNNVRHECVGHARIFDLEDPKQKRAYRKVLNRILNRSSFERKRIDLPPTPETPRLRVYLEWYEVEAYLDPPKPNARYHQR